MGPDTRRNPSDNASDHPAELTHVMTGIEGLNEILGGGLLGGRMYVVEGEAGTGKTTLALQFLLAGRAHNEPCLLITTNETRDDLTITAHSHGWTLDGIEVFELSLANAIAWPEQQQTVFLPSQVELDETMHTVLAELERVQPARVALDSMSTLRDMADQSFTYRRSVLSLRNALVARGCTALVTDELLTPQNLHLRSQVHGVIRLQQEVAPYGNQRRQVEVVKMRSMKFRSGRHDMLIETGGIRVFPRLMGESRDTDYARECLSTGVKQLDTLLGGGLDRGTSTLLMGTTGTGKSSVAMQCVAAALRRGQCAAVCLFDERPRTWFHRAEQLGFNLPRQAANGNLFVQQIDPARTSPSQYAHELRQTITQRGVQIVIIDSLTGYVNAMPDEHFLTLHLHELLTWLGQRGVTPLLVLDHQGLFEPATPPLDLSYLTDTVLFFRYFEYQGVIRRAMSVVKRRSGPHESTIHELTLGPNGMVVGEPLSQFRGVCSPGFPHTKETL